MAFLKALSGIASVGLGIAGSVSQSNAADAARAAERLDLEGRRQASILEFEKLDLDVEQLTRTAGVVTGGIGAALAGAGAEITSGVSAQARAVTLSALARDIEVLNLNADIATTRLGFGPESEGGKKIRVTSPEGLAAREKELQAKDAIRRQAFEEAGFSSFFEFKQEAATPFVPPKGRRGVRTPVLSVRPPSKPSGQ